MSDTARIDQRFPRTAAEQVAWLVLTAAAGFAISVISHEAIAQGAAGRTGNDAAADRSGEQIVAARCVTCHQTGEGGAPKIGDRAAWTPRMRQGVDYLVHSAIRGHGGMPARGGMADTTDAEIRSAIVYMFNADIASQKPSGAAKSAATAPAKPDGKHVTVAGTEVYLGLVPAQRLRAYSKDATEGSMHRGVPAGADDYHVNVSLFDAKTGAAITDAQVEVRIEEPGMTSESKKLEPMVINNARSYGNYFTMHGKRSYVITVSVQKPDSPRPVEARFEQRIN